MQNIAWLFRMKERIQYIQCHLTGTLIFLRLNYVLSNILCRSEKLDIRPNINTPRFQNVLSLAISNDKFYWPDGTIVYYEEYLPTCNCYYHNTYPFLNGRSYNKIIVNLPSAQPIPVPVNPPTSVQAIFGSYLAKTSWQPPHLLGFQGTIIIRSLKSLLHRYDVNIFAIGRAEYKSKSPLVNFISEIFSNWILHNMLFHSKLSRWLIWICAIDSTNNIFMQSIFHLKFLHKNF